MLADSALSDSFPPARDSAAVASSRCQTQVMGAFQPQPLRGAELLLMHCTAASAERPSAFARLERELGGELTRKLLHALVGPQGRRGSSSP
jgi:hypothetical protein